jgi:hypothetical protein
VRSQSRVASGAVTHAEIMGPNELLLWLSARREGSWGQFRSAAEEILSDADGTPANGRAAPYQEMRFALEQLGHVEFEGRDGEGGWRVARPVLAVSRQPENFIGIMCGARSSQLIARVRSAGGAGCEILQSEFHPSVVRISACELGPLSQVAADAGLGFQADTPVRILSCAARVEHLAGSRPALLPFGSDFEVSRFVVGRAGCRWVASSDAEAAYGGDGLYRFIRFQIPEHYMKQGGRVLKVDGQTAKFFLLAQRRRQVLRYDRLSRTLSVPGICRPPLLIDRALALCTGYPAAYEPGKRMLAYKGIGEDIAGFAASLLSQNGI